MAAGELAPVAQGVTARGRPWSGRLGPGIGCVHAYVDVDGVSHGLEVWWPVDRIGDPKPTDWATWAKHVEDRFEREQGNAPERAQVVSRGRARRRS